MTVIANNSGIPPVDYPLISRVDFILTTAKTLFFQKRYAQGQDDDEPLAGPSGVKLKRYHPLVDSDDDADDMPLNRLVSGSKKVAGKLKQVYLIMKLLGFELD